MRKEYIIDFFIYRTVMNKRYKKYKNTSKFESNLCRATSMSFESDCLQLVKLIHEEENRPSLVSE